MSSSCRGTAEASAWIAVPQVPTEAQFWAGVASLRLPIKGVRIDPQGKHYPALVGPNRPGFVVQYAAMVAAAAPAPGHLSLPAGFKSVPAEMDDTQWQAAVDALGMVKAAQRKMLADSKSRSRAAAMYQAMNAAASDAARRLKEEGACRGDG